MDSTFENQWWNGKQVVAWILLRDKTVVGAIDKDGPLHNAKFLAEASSEFAYAQHDEGVLQASVYEIERQLKTGAVAWSRSGDHSGDRVELTAQHATSMWLMPGRDEAIVARSPAFARASNPDSDADVTWRGLLFDRQSVLAAWPDTQAEHARSAALFAEDASDHCEIFRAIEYVAFSGKAHVDRTGPVVALNGAKLELIDAMANGLLAAHGQMVGDPFKVLGIEPVATNSVPMEFWSKPYSRKTFGLIVAKDRGGVFIFPPPISSPSAEEAADTESAASREKEFVGFQSILLNRADVLRIWPKDGNINLPIAAPQVKKGRPRKRDAVLLAIAAVFPNGVPSRKGSVLLDEINSWLKTNGHDPIGRDTLDRALGRRKR